MRDKQSTENHNTNKCSVPVADQGFWFGLSQVVEGKKNKGMVMCFWEAWEAWEGPLAPDPALLDADKL